MREGNINNKNDETSVQNLDIKDNNHLENNEKFVEDKKSSKDKVRKIILISFIILCILVTATLLVLKYIKINKDKENVADDLELPVATVQKKPSEDLKYVITDFKEMYYTNPIDIKEKEYKSGKLKVNGENEDKIFIRYIEISGLKDKTIQEKINKEIKDTAFKKINDLKSNEQLRVYVNVSGNFSNILSVKVNIVVYNNKNNPISNTDNCLNYNLATGDKIRLLDLFTSNTPFNSILYDAIYEAMAWNTEYNFEMSKEEWDKATNMDKRDTSEYEDEILKSIRKFNNIDKSNISFSISPVKLEIYFEDIDNKKSEDVIKMTSVNLLDYSQYITAFKRFIVADEIYEKNPTVKSLVFTIEHSDSQLYAVYGFEKENLFISMFTFSEEDEDYKNAIDKIVKKYNNEFINESKTLADKNKQKGYIVRSMYSDYVTKAGNDFGSENVISFSIYADIYCMDINYFNTEGIKSIAKANKHRSADAASFMMAIELNDNIKKLSSKEYYYYFDLKGNLIADSEEKLEKYINNKYKKVEEVVQEPEVNVYSE